MAEKCPMHAVLQLIFSTWRLQSSDPCSIRPAAISNARSYKCNLRIDIPEGADMYTRIFLLVVYVLKWIIVNAPVIVVSFILVAWGCEWSLLRIFAAATAYCAASLWYYLMHVSMHYFTPAFSSSSTNPFVRMMQWISMVHRKYHHGRVPHGQGIRARIMRDAGEIIYEILTGGGILALLPLPMPMVSRTFAVLFAICAMVMHHVNCHNMHTEFHDLHHKKPSTNFMPAFWDSVFGTTYDGPRVMSVVDENHTWWIAIVVGLAAKFLLPARLFKM